VIARFEDVRCPSSWSVPYVNIDSGNLSVKPVYGLSEFCVVAAFIHLTLVSSLRELRAQIAKAGGERQVEVEKAAKLLGSGVEKERWARAEKHALEDNIAAVKGELVARRAANQKGAWR
jgi:hypothetical protein